MGLLELVLPQRCLVCGVHGLQICDGCLAALPRVRAPLCARCGAPTAWPVERCSECSGRRLAFASARAAVVYDDSVRAFVAQWKEHGLRDLAEEAGALVVAAVPRPEVDALAFVPADGDRSRRRGHHPAARLARELAGRWQLPVQSSLVRTRSLPRQRGLSLADRRSNVRGAFRATAPVPRRVLLVDDVYTSGATVNAAASALRAAGARTVLVVTMARVVR